MKGWLPLRSRAGNLGNERLHAEEDGGGGERRRRRLAFLAKKIVFIVEGFVC